MTSPNSVFSELVATTWRKHRGEFRDNVSRHNALDRRLTKKKLWRSEDGGLSIAVNLDYASNGTYQRFSGYDFLNVSPSEVLSSAEYQWKQIAIHVTASGQELRINKGSNRIANLASARLRNAMRTFKNNFSFDLYSDGTLPNQINGLQALVSDTGLGTVGGIDSSAWPFWQNIVQSAAAPLQGGGAVTVSATTIENEMFLPLWLALTRGDDKPDLIVMDNNWFAFYEKSQVSLKRYTGDGLHGASGGMAELKYKTADVIFDGGSGIPADHFYMLNTDYFEGVVHEDANLTVVEDMRPYNQDASVTPVLWMGNLTCSNRALQGVGKA